MTGSKTGKHSGKIIGYSNGKGASFVPNKPFDEGETVSVTTPFYVTGGVGGRFSFHVGVAGPNHLAPVPTSMSKPKVQSFVSAPTLHPADTAVVTDNGPATGDLFTSPDGVKNLDGNEIDDQDGNLVYYDPTSANTDDFRVQTYQGKPALTWWQGNIVLPGYGRGADIIADSSYHVIKRVYAGNGLSADAHEFLLTNAGTALITAYAPVKADTTAAAGGVKSGDVLDCVIQEIDLKTNRVMFEWHALDHIPVEDSYVPTTTATVPWDFAHVNSVQPYGNGELLVSSRSAHELLTISRTTGVVHQRIGGRHPTVSEPSAASTHSQHDAEPHADGTITVFDNGAGAGANMHRTSRGLVLKLSGNKLKIVKTLAAPDDQLAYSQGNVQTLADGYLVDFGSTGSIVDYNSDGSVRRDMHYQPMVQTYRAFKTAWHATPTTLPSLAVSKTPTGSTAFVSWNGATEIASWRILTGPDANHLTQVATAAKSGFETTIPTATTSGLLYAVALDANGMSLGESTGQPIQ